jgi:hypothetical protein
LARGAQDHRSRPKPRREAQAHQGRICGGENGLAAPAPRGPGLYRRPFRLAGLVKPMGMGQRSIRLRGGAVGGVPCPASLALLELFHGRQQKR